jgi:hypothetical protein
MSHLAPQGSAEWLDRKHIGGSEIAVLNGTGAFKSWFDWLKERCQIKKSFCPIINSRWGHTFEDVQIRLIQQIWSCEIFETGSVPGNPGIAYSPDGVGVVPNDIVLKCLNSTHGEDNIEVPSDSHSIVLFEFKSPPKNMPKGEIPSYYVAQPLTGLCTIKLCEYSVFINSMFRRCSIEDFGWNMLYDHELHNKDKPADVTELLAIGAIGFYDPTSTEESDYIDYGKCELRDLEDMFYKESTNVIQKTFSKVILSNVFKKRIGVAEAPTEQDVSLDRFVNNFKSLKLGKLVGILPYKLFKIDFIKVNKQENFVNDLQPMIDRSLEIINTVKALPAESRLEKLLEYFPEKRKAPTPVEELKCEISEEDLVFIRNLQSNT